MGTQEKRSLQNQKGKKINSLGRNQCCFLKVGKGSTGGRRATVYFYFHLVANVVIIVATIVTIKS